MTQNIIDTQNKDEELRNISLRYIKMLGDFCALITEIEFMAEESLKIKDSMLHYAMLVKIKDRIKEYREGIKKEAKNEI